MIKCKLADKCKFGDRCRFRHESHEIKGNDHGKGGELKSEHIFFTCRIGGRTPNIIQV